MKRRDFLKLSTAGAATLILGSKLPWLGVKDAYAASQNLTITITDGLKDMHVKNTVNAASIAAGITDPNPLNFDPTMGQPGQGQCYFWVYQVTADGTSLPADCPGPTICCSKGDTITLTITNQLDENHTFFIPGIFDARTDAVDVADGVTKYPLGIPPGKSVTGTFTATTMGAHLYYDNLNEPVNRVMGLHGALIVSPNLGPNGTARPPYGGNWTPYDNPTPHVKALFNSFGTSVYPGLKWEEGDANQASFTPAFRTYSWILHQASPNLFYEVGNFTPGQDYPAADFQQKFLFDGYSPVRQNYIPQYFTMNGLSGFFSHFSPTVTPMGRIGEPIVIHIMNAGLWTHSMHFHFNHFYVTYDSSASNGGVSGDGVSQNPLWVDIYNIDPMDTVDYVLPFMRQPSIPTNRGLGLPDPPRWTQAGAPCYPPVEEMGRIMPSNVSANRLDGSTVPLDQLESPLCYPMHDHAEPSQTSQGGNYNTGMISGAYVIGDRNLPNQLDGAGQPLSNRIGGGIDFPMEKDFASMYRGIRGFSGTDAVKPLQGTVPAGGTGPVP